MSTGTFECSSLLCSRCFGVLASPTPAHDGVSIKTPILCCVKTQNLNVNVCDGEEQKPEEEMDEEKGVWSGRGRFKEIRKAYSQRLLPVWRGRGIAKRSPSIKETSKSKSSESGTTCEAGESSGDQGLSKQATLVHCSSEGGETAIQTEENIGANSQTQNRR